MAVYFFDTSALVKKYVAELGSSWVIEQCEPELNHTITISQATLVEAVAALCRKAREQNTSQRITEADRDRHIRLFRQDARRHYSVVRVTSTIYTRAGDLCRIHRLRAYDAIQLACALAVRDKLTIIGAQAPVFVSADNDLLDIAQNEGLSIKNPNG